jgi:hypothetical protein
MAPGSGGGQYSGGWVGCHGMRMGGKGRVLFGEGGGRDEQWQYRGWGGVGGVYCFNSNQYYFLHQSAAALV